MMGPVKREREGWRLERPAIADITDSRVFRAYYYLLSELQAYCREKGLPLSGGKQAIADRIAHYIDTGETLPPAPAAKKALRTEAITPESIIEADIKCSQVHRAFFKDAIGKRFTFNVAFQQWLRENAGRTYQEAVEAYGDIQAAMREGQTVISRQFEYNTYIRAFFADNEGRPLQDAIRCWKRKKSLPGHNRYERADLDALEGQ